MRYSCGHVSTKKNVRGIKDAATSTPPQLRSSRYIRYRDNIGYPRYGERYDIGDNQYSSNNLSYCPINRFLESITILTCSRQPYAVCAPRRWLGQSPSRTGNRDTRAEVTRGEWVHSSRNSTPWSIANGALRDGEVGEGVHCWLSRVTSQSASLVLILQKQLL